MSTPRRRWISNTVFAFIVLTAFFLVFPNRWRIAPAWVSAANFAIGTGLILVAFVEIGRALRAWFTRKATLGWIGAGMLAGAGLFVAGEASITDAPGAPLNWFALAGILTAAIASVVQQRVARAADTA